MGVEMEGGEIAQRRILAGEGGLGVPDLEAAAGAHEQGLRRDAAPPPRHWRKHQSPASVEFRLLTEPEEPAGTGMMRGRRDARLLVGNPAALGVGMEQAGMKPVESGNAGVGLVRREQHRPSVGPALEHGAHERRQRDAAMPIDSA